MRDALLRIYLNDHLAGSVAAVEQAEHCIARNRDNEVGAELPAILAQIRADQDVVVGLLDRIGAGENPLKQAAAWLAEKAVRAKPSGAAGYSDLTRLEELEALALGITGKQMLWKALSALGDPRFGDVDFRTLTVLAGRQRAVVERLRLGAAARALAPRPTGGGGGREE